MKKSASKSASQTELPLGRAARAADKKSPARGKPKLKLVKRPAGAGDKEPAPALPLKVAAAGSTAGTTAAAEAIASGAMALPEAAGPRRRATAETLATKQREISVAEFFTKNRHLLGFDNPAKALLTTVKEAVDNSLDACEEAGILPELLVEITEINQERFRVAVQDNGPGIVAKQVPNIFGKLLYGSKFHRLRQSRGQQGIGISAAGMYGLLTTGKPVVITSRTGKGRPAHHFELIIDTKKNRAEVIVDTEVEWEGVDHGTRVEIELAATYKTGRRSLDEYLSQTAIANPHARVFYQPPKGRPQQMFERASSELPPEPKEIKPHPHGVELGALIETLKSTKARWLSSALQEEFSRVSLAVAQQICEAAGLDPHEKPQRLSTGDVEKLHRAIPTVKILAPPASCVVPIGETLVHAGLAKEIKADFVVSCTRPPAVYRGNPFVIEVGLAYGGELIQGGEAADDDDGAAAGGDDGGAADQPIRLLRLANRVPLLYQQSACAIFGAVTETRWKNYGLTQPRGSLPLGPMVLMVHMASVWVPFTSESKEAIAHYPQIIKEVKLALAECGRRLATHLRSLENRRHEAKRRSIFELYCGELVESLHSLTGREKKKLKQQLLDLAKKHTGFDEDEDEGVDDAVAAADTAGRGGAGDDGEED
ncbi:MAG TPA: DNA topoisomerase VI subunit B [Myxococcota bacterium]|jgi:DNA topoisomerase-6 subunit B|nr:DNA topoisomerase VI subunit B [Myxococcota bacterium]